jgi:hypothetical protein
MLLGHPSMMHNGSGLGEVAELAAQKFSLAQMFI